MDRPNELSWYSLDGLPNKGRVVFHPSSDPPMMQGVTEQTVMTLTISYDLPLVAVNLFESLGGSISMCLFNQSRTMRRPVGKGLR